jgi:hypothetical protein
MGRRAKYATLRKYQPYIDVIRKDLGIPDDAHIEVMFVAWRSSTRGDAIYYPGSKYGEIHVSKFYSHAETLRILLHELRHVWQYYSGMFIKTHKLLSWGKKTRYVSIGIWDGKEYEDYSGKANKYFNKYRSSPWEVDAREYEKELYRLFPGCKLPSNRILVAETKTMKLYRERS